MPENISFFASSINFFLNLLELFAVIVSCATFFFLMINKYSYALVKILSPSGFGIMPRLRALFICRKSPIKKRAFIEYALLKTQGHGSISSEWHTILNEFRAFYAANETNLVYSIENITPLIGEDFSIAASRYFEYFSTKKVKKAFGITDDRIGWVIKIRIKEAYATPTCLLTGLLSRFEENWAEFIKRYVSTAYISETDDNKSNDVLSNELYLTFAWLLWGPSFEIKYTDYWAGLCQLSYGDESNSIPAVASMTSNTITKLQHQFTDKSKQRYGILLSADVTIFENKAYYKGIRSIINPENAYFYNKIVDGSISFAAQIDDFTVCDNFKSKKYYCTAYVWLLFELENEGFYFFRPENSIAFFEHANLTDKKSYQFLIETLIDKSIKHFTNVFANPDYASRRYRFICAMNDEIVAAVSKRYTEIMSMENEVGKHFLSRIILEPKHSPTDVFSAYDEYFAPSNTLTYIEVSLKNKDSLSDLGRFYAEIYRDGFPNRDERESFDNILDYLENAETATEYRYHILLAKDSHGSIVGGGIFDYFFGTNSGIIEFIVVKSDAQSRGTGTKIYRQVINIMSRDAHMINKRNLDYVFCETDSPEYSKDVEKSYLHFWSKLNYSRLDFSYIQPPLSPDKHPVTGLWFVVSSQAGKLDNLNGELVINVISDYMKSAMKISNPEDSPEFRTMKNELLSKPINLLRII